MRATVSPDRLDLTEVRRFRNGPVPVGDRLHWDVLGLWTDILGGLRDAGDDLAAIGIDTWAVDYGLIGAGGLLLGNPRNYRDHRTAGIAEQVDATLPRFDLYRRNGLQYLPFNTIYQFLADRAEPLLGLAERALLIPDLLGYWLTGEQRAEVTNASTTGLLDPTTRRWAPDLVDVAGLAPGLLPRLIEPGTVLGAVRPEIGGIAGTAGVDVVAVGSHDTASAIVGVPAASDNFAYIACGTWGLVGVELAAPVLTEASQQANFTNELGVDGTVRYLRNVMGLWVLQQCHAEWQRNSSLTGRSGGQPIDIAAVVAQAEAQPTGGPLIDIDDPSLLAPGDMVFRVQELCRVSGQHIPDSLGEVARCVLDSLAQKFGATVRQAAELSGKRVDVVHLVGGGVQNELLCRLTAAATGLPVVAGPVEATAIGNVLVQARTVGTLSGGLADLRDLVVRTHRLRTYQP